MITALAILAGAVVGVLALIGGIVVWAIAADVIRDRRRYR